MPQRRATRRLSGWLRAVAWLCLAGIAGATQAAADPRAEFAAFFDTLAGNWRCEVRQYDASGAMTWQDSQQRVFLVFLADRVYAQEAYLLRRSTGEWVRAGLQLIGFDAETGQVLMDSYWSFRPGRNDHVSGRLSADFRGIAGEAVSEREPDIHRRYELRLQDDGTLVERSYRRGPDGREYLDHELSYQRSSATIETEPVRGT